MGYSHWPLPPSKRSLGIKLARWFWYAPRERVRTMRLAPKRWFQRARYGISEEDTWNGDVYLAGIIAKLCRELIDIGHSVPLVSIAWAREHGYEWERHGENDPGDLGSLTITQWDEILGTIADAFELYAANAYSMRKRDDERWAAAWREFERFYPNLWD